MKFLSKAAKTLIGLALLASFGMTAKSQDFPVSTSNTNVGYIDPATIGNRLRFRFDAGYDLFPPDRAEFFYEGSQPGTQSRSVDYQEFSAYLETARNEWLSTFIETPVRLVNPDAAENTAGMADINLGFKAMLLGTENSCTTLQVRTYLPTGDGDRRLGTGNVNIEPGILQYLRLSDRWLMENEVKTWVPITSNDFAGTVMRYGVGLSYNQQPACRCQLTASPVFEVVGWSVLDGSFTDEVGTIQSAAGDTIVNAKAGLRFNYDDKQIYAGMGQALTSDTWYDQIFRLEYRRRF